MRNPSRAIVLLACVLVSAAEYNLAQQPAAPAGAKTEAQPLEPGKPVERELKSGEAHAYNVTLGAGQFLDAAVNQRGIDVIVRVFAPDGSRVAEVDSPNGTQGDEPIKLEARAGGTYRIEVSPLAQEGDTPAGRYEIRINEVLSADAYARRVAEIKRKRQAVIAWLKQNAIPIKTVEAGSGFEDLQPLKRVLKDVRFVGLGEATHGTREFFQFKHRMLEFLVKEMGFRVFAIEASYSACENINDYVMGKSDDGAKALDSQGFWTWNTEEVRAMIDWMREYARVLAQFMDSYSEAGPHDFVARDLYMADNFRRIAEREPAGTRFVLWAHNGHIAATDRGGSYPTFGYHLRQFYGAGYYALGFSFNQGSFQSREAQPDSPARRMLMPFTVKPAPEDSVDWYLAQTGVKSFVVDLRSPRKSAELGEWLAATRGMRSIGSMYNPSFESRLPPAVIGKEFDGVFFIDTTTRARPNPSVPNVAPGR